MAISRKGLARQQLMLLLLVFALIFVLIIFAKNIKDILGVVSDVELCKASVILSSAKYETKVVRVIPVSVDSPLKIKCKTEFIELKDKVPIEDYNVELRGDARDKEILKKFIFEKLALCWYQFGGGKVEVYNSQKESRVCSICSKIVTGEKFKELHPGGITFSNKELYKYAEATEYNENMNYLTYLTGEAENMPDIGIIENKGEIKLGVVGRNENKPYFIVLQVVDEGSVTLFQDVGDDGGGIVDCSVGDSDYDVTGSKAKKIGCMDTWNSGVGVEGVNFGRIIKKGIVTVRMVPASGITADNCERLV